MGGAEPDGLGDGVTERNLRAVLGEWAAEDAAAARGRERWLRQQAEATATLTGTLLDAAERRDVLVVRTRSGAWTGRVVGVGRDFAVLETPTTTVVALRSLLTVAPAPGGAIPGSPATGTDRPAALAMDLIDVLQLLGADRSQVRLHLADGETEAGTLWSVGADVADLLLEGPGRRHVLVALAAIAAVTPA